MRPFSSAVTRSLRAISRSAVCRAFSSALVAAPADQLARQQPGVGLERHAPLIAGMQARNVDAGGQQQRHGGVQHVGHRRVDPFHRRAGTGQLVEGAVGELPARRPGIAKAGEGRPDVGARQAARSARCNRATAAASPGARPVRAAGRTESRSRRPSRAAAPATGRKPPGSRSFPVWRALTGPPASCPSASTMALRRVGLLEKSQPSNNGSITALGTCLAMGRGTLPAPRRPERTLRRRRSRPPHCPWRGPTPPAHAPPQCAPAGNALPRCAATRPGATRRPDARLLARGQRRRARTR